MRQRGEGKRINGLVILLVILLVALAVFVMDLDSDREGLGVYLEPSTQNVILTWTDNADNEQGFRVYRRDVSVGGIQTCINCGSTGVVGSGDCNDPINPIASTAGIGTCTDPAAGLLQNHNYDYWVSAWNANGESALVTTLVSPSVGVQVTTAPDAPDSLAFVSSTETTITLSWNDNSDIEGNFELERDGATVNSNIAANVGTGTVSYTDMGLSVGTTYAYRVRACSNTITGYRCSAWTGPSVSGTTSSAPVVAPAITEISSSTGTVADPSQVLITQNTILTITGNNFDPANARVKVFGNDLVPMPGATSTQLQIDLLNGNALCPGLCLPGTYNIIVDNAPGNPDPLTKSSPMGVVFEMPAPSNVGLNPTSISNLVTGGNTLIISGSDFYPSADYGVFGSYLGSYVQYKLQTSSTYTQVYQPGLVYNNGNLELFLSAGSPLPGDYDVIVSNLGSGVSVDPSSSPPELLTVTGVLSCGTSTCLMLGVCGTVPDTCDQVTGQWTCNYPSTYQAGTEAGLCDDGLDNDCDDNGTGGAGGTDCSDSDCSNDPACTAPSAPGSLGVNLN